MIAERGQKSLPLRPCNWYSDHTFSRMLNKRESQTRTYTSKLFMDNSCVGRQALESETVHFLSVLLSFYRGVKIYIMMM